MKPLLFFLLITTCCNCQVADSMLQSILLIGNDTEMVNRLYQRGFSLRNNDPRVAWEYALACEKVARNGTSGKHLAKSYNLRGVLFYKRGDYRNALKYHEMALALRKQANDEAGVAMSLTNLGNIYSDKSQFARAENCYLEALNVNKRLGRELQAANCLINIGALKQQTGLQDVACEYYELALKLGERLNDYEIRSICLNNLAVALAARGDYQQAIAFNEDALKIRRFMENRLEEADSYINLASVFVQLKMFEQAREYLDSAMGISSANDYFSGRQEVYKTYAGYFEAVNDLPSAYKYLKRYSELRDSVSAAGEPDSTDLEQSGTTVATGLKNGWLIFSLLIFLIFVPVLLFNFRR